METLNQNPNTVQPARRNPEPPFAVFARAVDRGEVCLELYGDSVTGEVADDQTWHALLDAAAAHPERLFSCRPFHRILQSGFGAATMATATKFLP